MPMYDHLPNDPVMLLSFINTKLRDHYESLDAFLAAYQLDRDTIVPKMKDIDYEYDADINQFV